MWKLVTLVCAGIASALASELTAIEVKQNWRVCLQQCSNTLSTCQARNQDDYTCVYAYSHCVDNCDDIHDDFDVIKVHQGGYPSGCREQCCGDRGHDCDSLCLDECRVNPPVAGSAVVLSKISKKASHHHHN